MHLFLVLVVVRRLFADIIIALYFEETPATMYEDTAAYYRPWFAIYFAFIYTFYEVFTS